MKTINPHGKIKLKAKKDTLHSLLVICCKYRERPIPVTNLYRYIWLIEHDVLVSVERKIAKKIISTLENECAITFTRSEAETILHVVSTYQDDSENYDNIFTELHADLQRISLI